MKNELIAIIGGGPAGSLAATRLAANGRAVVLLEEKLAWEKPCGGGVTAKALAEYSFLGDAEIERNWVEQCELISSSGRRVTLHLDQPIAVFSRQVLNGLLLSRAQDAGAEVIKARVSRIHGSEENWKLDTSEGEVRATYLVIATGARNPFRAQFSRHFASDDLMATAGYYIPGSGRPMQIRFIPGLHGYVWIFPRTSHYSAGICGKMNGKTTGELRLLLEQCLLAEGLKFQGTKFYAHILPALSRRTLREAPIVGGGWAMIGDAAGFTDPITGEGLYYALRSAEVLSQALLSGCPRSYSALLKKDFLADLETAASVADRFFTGRWMGQPVTERMIRFTAHSPKFQQLMCDLFAGRQGYRNLRQRLYRSLPAMLAEGAASALGLRQSPGRR